MKIWRVGFGQELTVDVAADAVPSAVDEAMEAIEHVWEENVKKNKELSPEEKKLLKPPEVKNITSVVLVTETAN